MMRYCAVARVVFAVVFMVGALVHVYFGLFSPHSYLPYADTALWSWLSALWRGLVMAHIGWLSLVTAVFELTIGLGLLARGRAPRLAALAALVFLAFILVLGYSWPTSSLWEDFFKNRAFTLVMAAALAPLLRAPDGLPRTRAGPAWTAESQSAALTTASSSLASWPARLSAGTSSLWLRTSVAKVRCTSGATTRMPHSATTVRHCSTARIAPSPE